MIALNAWAVPLLGLRERAELVPLAQRGRLHAVAQRELLDRLALDDGVAKPPRPRALALDPARERGRARLVVAVEVLDVLLGRRALVGVLGLHRAGGEERREQRQDLHAASGRPRGGDGGRARV